MKKNLLRQAMSLLLAAVLVASCLFAINVAAEGENIVQGTTGSIKWVLDLDRYVLTLSGTGETDGYYNAIKGSFYDRPWQNYLAHIEKIVVEEGVTRIGSACFCDCNQLVSLSLPSSLKSIGRAAFSSDIRLGSIDLPKGLTSIEPYAFENCQRLSGKLIIPGVLNIGDTAFSNCTALTDVVISRGTISVGSAAFDGCTSLKTVTLSQGVVSVGEKAFGSCSALTDIYYGGTEDEWSDISINATGNQYFNTATKHFNVHDHRYITERVEPDCTHTGAEVKTCAECGEKITNIIPATGHFYGEEIEGVKSCIVCGHVQVHPVEITVCDARANKGQVKVPITLDYNPGISTLLLKIGYDSEVFTLSEVIDGEILGEAVHSDKLTADPYTLSWENDLSTTDIPATGVIATLVFDIKEEAVMGNYNITVTKGQAANSALELFETSCTDGTVRFDAKLIGDINDDGEVTPADRMMLSRFIADWDGYDTTTCNIHAADVNGDGEVDVIDRMILARFVADWEDYKVYFE